MNIKDFCMGIVFGLRYAQQEIKGWKLPPKADALFDEIWKELPPKIQQAIWDFVKKVYDKYGKELAIALIASILALIKEKGWLEKSDPAIDK